MRAKNKLPYIILMLVLVVSSCGGPSKSEARPAVGDTKNVEGNLALENRKKGLPSLEVVSPKPNSTVSSPVAFIVDVENYNLAPSGQVQQGEGHFHILIDTGCVKAGEQIPDPTDLIFHVSNGSRQQFIELPPGEYEACVQVGDGFHTALNIFAETKFTVE